MFFIGKIHKRIGTRNIDATNYCGKDLLLPIVCEGYVSGIVRLDKAISMDNLSSYKFYSRRSEIV